MCNISQPTREGEREVCDVRISVILPRYLVGEVFWFEVPVVEIYIIRIRPDTKYHLKCFYIYAQTEMMMVI